MNKKNFALFLCDIIFIKTSSFSNVHELCNKLNDFIITTYPHNLYFMSSIFDIKKLNNTIIRNRLVISEQMLSYILSDYINGSSLDNLVENVDPKTLFNIVQLAQAFVDFELKQEEEISFQDNCNKLYGRILQ